MKVGILTYHWANNYGAEGEKFNLTWSATKTHESNVS